MYLQDSISSSDEESADSQCDLEKCNFPKT